MMKQNFHCIFYECRAHVVDVFVVAISFRAACSGGRHSRGAIAKRLLMNNVFADCQSYLRLRDSIEYWEVASVATGVAPSSRGDTVRYNDTATHSRQPYVKEHTSIAVAWEHTRQQLKCECLPSWSTNVPTRRDRPSVTLCSRQTTIRKLQALMLNKHHISKENCLINHHDVELSLDQFL